ncbi:MAG: prepilin-type N-terminal cleavage/methylation domain-containing protein [Candidatus Omnitrophota bacterium]|jgi:prepilin-type N-terminal cleavage/methylation domain-containing protein
MKRSALNKKGFTMVEIMITMAVIAVLAAIAVPNFMRVRRIAQQNACIHNLKTIDEAKDMWALMEGKTSLAVPAWGDLVTNYIKKTPVCPSGGTYTINAVDTYPECTETDHELL